MKTAWKATMTSNKEGNLWDDIGCHGTTDFINNATLNFVCVFLPRMLGWLQVHSDWGGQDEGRLEITSEWLGRFSRHRFLGFDTFFMSALISISMVEKGSVQALQHYHKWHVTFFHSEKREILRSSNVGRTITSIRSLGQRFFAHYFDVTEIASLASSKHKANLGLLRPNGKR